MNQLRDKELDSAIREVIKRSVVDPEFRKLAIKNANAAITKASGKSLPNGITINFVHNYGVSAKSYVLPDPAADPDLLSDEALEKVAGGCGTSGPTG
jgi:hypothetical protein